MQASSCAKGRCRCPPYMGIPSYARTSYCCIYATAAVLVYQASVMQDRCLFLFLRNIQQPTANRQPRYVVLAEASSLFHCARTNERTKERAAAWIFCFKELTHCHRYLTAPVLIPGSKVVVWYAKETRKGNMFFFSNRPLLSSSTRLNLQEFFTPSDLLGKPWPQASSPPPPPAGCAR